MDPGDGSDLDFSLDPDPNPNPNPTPKHSLTVPNPCQVRIAALEVLLGLLRRREVEARIAFVPHAERIATALGNAMTDSNPRCVCRELRIPHSMPCVFPGVGWRNVGWDLVRESERRNG